MHAARRLLKDRAFPILPFFNIYIYPIYPIRPCAVEHEISRRDLIESAVRRQSQSYAVNPPHPIPQTSSESPTLAHNGMVLKEPTKACTPNYHIHTAIADPIPIPEPKHSTGNAVPRPPWYLCLTECFSFTSHSQPTGGLLIIPRAYHIVPYHIIFWCTIIYLRSFPSGWVSGRKTIL